MPRVPSTLRWFRATLRTRTAGRPINGLAQLQRGFEAAKRPKLPGAESVLKLERSLWRRTHLRLRTARRGELRLRFARAHPRVATFDPGKRVRQSQRRSGSGVRAESEAGKTNEEQIKSKRHVGRH